MCISFTGFTLYGCCLIGSAFPVSTSWNAITVFLVHQETILQTPPIMPLLTSSLAQLNVLVSSLTSEFLSLGLFPTSSSCWDWSLSLVATHLATVATVPLTWPLS